MFAHQSEDAERARKYEELAAELRCSREAVSFAMSRYRDDESKVRARIENARELLDVAPSMEVALTTMEDCLMETREFRPDINKAEYFPPNVES